MVKRKNRALRSRILKRKPKDLQVFKKLALAIVITLLAAILYSQVASHTRAAKDRAKLEQTYIQLNTSKTALQKEIDAHHLTDQQQQQQIQDLNKKLQDTEQQLQAKRNTRSVYAAAAPLTPSSTYSGSGDPYLDYIIAHESSGNQYAMNSIGACGLFQALPCGKMGCALSDVQCQLAWGRNYAVSRYGSTYAAYLFWTANHWW
jgi:type II secretory pathway pseudopilin PulG